MRKGVEGRGLVFQAEDEGEGIEAEDEGEGGKGCIVVTAIAACAYVQDADNASAFRLHDLYLGFISCMSLHITSLHEAGVD